MYTTRALYYLNQIGILPWIKREITLPVPKDLYIMPSANLCAKGKSLLKKMLDFAGIKLERYEFIKEQDCNLLPSNSKNPLVILYLYQDKNHSPPILAPDVILFGCPSPDILLKIPKQKKEALEPLLSLSQLLNK